MPTRPATTAAPFHCDDADAAALRAAVGALSPEARREFAASLRAAVRWLDVLSRGVPLAVLRDEDGAPTLPVWDLTRYRVVKVDSGCHVFAPNDTCP